MRPKILQDIMGYLKNYTHACSLAKVGYLKCATDQWDTCMSVGPQHIYTSMLCWATTHIYYLECICVHRQLKQLTVDIALGSAQLTRRLTAALPSSHGTVLSNSVIRNGT